jgi:hypothetical protein
MRYRSIFTRRLIWAGCLGLAYALLVPGNARADDTDQPRWQFYFTPYLWISGVSGTTSSANPNIPSQTATASFGDLLSHLNSVPIIGAFEARYGRFGVLTDLMVISLRSNFDTQNVLFTGGSATVTELISTILPNYRVVDTGDQSLDLGVGARVFADWLKLSFNSGLLPGFSRSPTISWAAAIFGGRYHLDLPRGFGLTAYGDIGTGPNLTWQALGTVDYRYNDWMMFHLGYRHLHIGYQGDGLNSDTALSGPLAAATIRF